MSIISPSKSPLLNNELGITLYSHVACMHHIARQPNILVHINNIHVMSYAQQCTYSCSALPRSSLPLCWNTRAIQPIIDPEAMVFIVAERPLYHGYSLGTQDFPVLRVHMRARKIIVRGRFESPTHNYFTRMCTRNTGKARLPWLYHMRYDFAVTQARTQSTAITFTVFFQAGGIPLDGGILHLTVVSFTASR